MGNRATSVASDEKRLLYKKPLLYLNFSKKQKLLAYDYLIGHADMPLFEPSFDAQTLDILDEYQQSVSELLTEAAEHSSKTKRSRIQEIALIKAYKQMYDTGSTKLFMDAVKTLYGLPNKGLFWSTLQNTLEQARNNSKNKLELVEVEKLIQLNQAPKTTKSNSVPPSAKVFKNTQLIFKKLYAEEVSKLKYIVAKMPAIHRYQDEEIIALFDELLKHYKLDKKGWRAISTNKAERVMVNYDTRQIWVAKSSFRLSRSRAIGWALHEVAVHARSRKKILKKSKDLGERRVIEEGLGIFLEQMVFKRFQPVRSLRYIALGLALGLDGKPRSAKEVYEIIWRLRYLGGVAKNRKISKEYAAKEVIRVFRGVPFDQKGVVITKDRAYIEGNQAVWTYIEENGADFIFRELLDKKL